MRIPNRFLLTLASLGVVAFAPAQAVLVSVDDAVFGAGSFTRDTASGLEWLDISGTTRRTYAYVESQLGPGGEFAGLRHATTGEISDLFVHGIPVLNSFTGADANVAPALALLALTGAASFQGQFPEALGSMAGVPGPTFFQNSTPAYWASVGGASRNPTFEWATIDHWLVRLQLVYRTVHTRAARPRARPAAVGHPEARRPARPRPAPAAVRPADASGDRSPAGMRAQRAGKGPLGIAVRRAAGRPEARRR